MCSKKTDEYLHITAGDLYKIVCNLPSDEKKQWEDNIYKSMKKGIEEKQLPLEDILTALYSKFFYPMVGKNNNVVAYGAGNMAKEYIPKLVSIVNIEECWDSFTHEKYIDGVKISRPRKSEVLFTTPIVIFVDDLKARTEITSSLVSAGYSQIYYFRDYMMLLHILDYTQYITEYVTEKTLDVLRDFVGEFTYIDNIYPSVCISVLPNKFKKESLKFKEAKDKWNDIAQRLYAELLCLEDEEKFKESLSDVVRINNDNIFDFAYNLECFARNLLKCHLKTKKRPIRMAEDHPYDPFVAFTVLHVIFEETLSDDEALKCVEEIYEFSKDASVVTLSLMCHFLLKCKRMNEALSWARHGIVVYPNSLLMNEIFYEIAFQCKKEGIEVSEPLPEYDLSESFCWSGINFAWCGGMEPKSGNAMWGPCFRPLQCAALPDGEFWTSEEWTEFRKSLIDGTFRYCQKNQCPNIVAGWLPKKAAFQEGKLGRILAGDFSVVPDLKELHLSYDNHCNLACPSCRTEIKTNSKEDNCAMDEMFEKNIRPYLEHAEHLCLSGCGEAILSPHSKKMLQSLNLKKYPSLKIELRTNGTVLTKKTWESLGEGRRLIKHIAISIDAASKSLFEKLRFPAKWDNVMNNLSFISELRKTDEIDLLEFHVVVQSENLDELENIVSLAATSCADVVTFSKIINWRSMPPKEYLEKNPFFINSPGYIKLKKVIGNLVDIRKELESKDDAEGNKMFINIHFIPDPNERYDIIRTGNLKIR